MNKSLLWGSLGVLLLAHFAAGSPVQPFGEPRGYRQVSFEPYLAQNFTLRCRAKERTAVVVYGQGSSPMALYVFDSHGNCVARDDVSLGVVSDDLAVEWRPPTEDAYDIEIRNLGRKVNVAEIAIR